MMVRYASSVYCPPGNGADVHVSHNKTQVSTHTEFRLPSLIPIGDVRAAGEKQRGPGGFHAGPIERIIFH